MCWHTFARGSVCPEKYAASVTRVQRTKCTHYIIALLLICGEHSLNSIRRCVKFILFVHTKRWYVRKWSKTSFSIIIGVHNGINVRVCGRIFRSFFKWIGFRPFGLRGISRGRLFRILSFKWVRVASCQRLIGTRLLGSKWICFLDIWLPIRCLRVLWCFMWIIWIIKVNVSTRASCYVISIRTRSR